jgi:hypothetical protein
MSGFVVDSRTLEAVRDTLGRLNEQLVGMHTVIWHQSGTLGGVALETELEDFCGRWHYGVAELGGQLQDLTRRLSEAAQAYERIEQRITQASGGSAGAHHTAAKHSDSGHHPAKHPDARHHSAGGGKNYSGGAPIAPAGGGNHAAGDQHSKGGDKHPGVGSGTTVIGGGPPQWSSSRGGSGTTTIDEQIHHAERRQQAELNAVLKMVKD